MELLHKDLSEKIIKCYYKVYNTLGYGFLEKVYENAMIVHFEREKIKAEQQKEIKINYLLLLLIFFYRILLIKKMRLKFH
jgi:GxxExxY protein